MSYSREFQRFRNKFRTLIFGIKLGTIRMEKCFATESKVLNSMLWGGARDRATSSEPRAPVAIATRKAVLKDRSSKDRFLSEPLMAMVVS